MKTGVRISLSFIAAVIGGLILPAAMPVEGQNLFVTVLNGNVIQITPGGIQSTDNTARLNNPAGVAFDKGGKLYVANYSHDDVIEIPPGGTNTEFAMGLIDPYNLAFDAGGNLYVASVGGITPGNGYITKIAPGGTQTPFASSLSGPYGLAFNSTGILFESESAISTGVINEFAPGGAKIQFASGFGDAYGLAFDTKGNLFAAIFNSNSIVEFTNDNGTLSATPNVFATGLQGPVGLAFDASGNLFVANDLSTNVTEITPLGAESAFATGFSQFNLWGLAFQPAPKLQGNYAKGTFQLSVTMPSPYSSTIVQASSNLLNWISIYTNTPPYNYTDSTSASASGRYYRVFLGP